MTELFKKKIFFFVGEYIYIMFVCFEIIPHRLHYLIVFVGENKSNMYENNAIF